MTQQSMNENVAEGDLPPGQRPQPGPRPPREVWLGDRGDAVSYTHLTLPTTLHECRSRWAPYH